jgi:hypothetical protein
MDETGVERWTFKTAVQQIDACGFECEAGPIANSEAWRWIKDRLTRPTDPGEDKVERAFAEGFAAGRAAATAVAQQHLEPQLARRLVAQSNAETAFAGFLLAAEHLRDDILYMPDDASAAIAAMGHTPPSGEDALQGIGGR